MTEQVQNEDGPWAKAGMAHDNTYLRLAAQVVNWRRAFFIMAVIAAGAVGGVVWIGSQSKFIPMVVEVDKLGRTVAVRALTGPDAVTDSSRTVYRELFDLMENLRTVTTDRAANDRNIERAFTRLDGAARTYARTELRKALPNEVGSTKTVQVQVKTALRLSDKSWQVEWEEHLFGLNGEPMGVENWKATLQYELLPAEDEVSIRKNPIGFTVRELSWMRVI